MVQKLFLFSYATDSLPYHKCISCDTTAQDNAMTTGCKQQQCMGHFCTLATQRIVSAPNVGRMSVHAQINEKQGCINVTGHHKVCNWWSTVKKHICFQIQLGCSHKWMNNEEEELFCACIGDLCNGDLNTASASKSIPVKPFYGLLISLVICILSKLFKLQ